MNYKVTKPPLKFGKMLGALMGRFGLGGKFYGGVWNKDTYKHRDDIINNVIFGVAKGGDGKSNFDKAWEDPQTGWVATLNKYKKEILAVPQAKTAKTGGKGRRRTKKRRKRNLKKRTRRRRRR